MNTDELLAAEESLKSNKGSSSIIMWLENSFVQMFLFLMNTDAEKRKVLLKVSLKTTYKV